jgi:hypothetical protein
MSDDSMVCPFPLARIAEPMAALLTFLPRVASLWPLLRSCNAEVFPATICFLRSLRVTSKAQAINGPITNAAMIFTFIPTSNLHCRLARGSGPLHWVSA